MANARPETRRRRASIATAARVARRAPDGAARVDYHSLMKPVQAGFPRDLDTVEALVSNQSSHFFPETYLLQTPASPHAAAKLDGIDISLDDMIPPATKKDLIIEGAGGILVPLNQNDLVIDLEVSFNIMTAIDPS